jgi:hypothetical protein
MGYAVDSHFQSAAPFRGNVFAIKAPHVSYRVVGRNDGAQSKLERPDIIRTRYAANIPKNRQLDVDLDCWRYAVEQLICPHTRRPRGKGHGNPLTIHFNGG